MQLTATRPVQAQAGRGARWWLFPLACGLLVALLILLPLVTAPGDIIGDTKLNLAVNPAGFLSRALTLWDTQQFGELQDQAVGYLFPMGPFFLLGKLAAMPAWIIQRTWIAALLVAAFAGTVRLAGRLGIGTEWTRLAAGLAYALSPMALGIVGELSGGFLPMAMAPWILLPLVTAAQGPRATLIARSAVAVALCGGINATSTLGAVAPAAIYLLTRPAGIRWRLLAWWTPAVLLASAWWWLPLALQSKYGVSPVPYTESAATTTAVTSLSDVLRGTSDWIGYLNIYGAAWWPLAFRMATSALPTIVTAVIAAIGLAGLIRRDARIPERRFLLVATLAGVVIIAAGYVSSLGNPLAGPLDSLINGPLSALRNLWKFDPVIRLPVALGFAQALMARRKPYVACLGAAAIAVLAIPAYLSGLAAAGAFAQVPSYWVEAAGWLNVHAGHQGVLVEPGAQDGLYIWGSPIDDVLSPLTSADYAERDLSDIGSPGQQRLLAAIDAEISAGRGSAGLTQTIARMGITYVVVRNDLNRAVLDGAWPARVNQALSESPGMTRVAQFGLQIGNPVPDDGATNFDPPYPAVEIYRVAGALPVATVQPAAGTLRVYGGPEALLTLAGENLLGSRPVLINDDGAGLPVGSSIVTDTLRRQVRNFGELRTSYSPTLTASQPAVTPEAATDYTEPGWDTYQAVARYIGIANVTASSSASDITANPSEWASGLDPFAAVDGNTRTMWESGSWTGPQGQWIQISFDSPVNPGTIRVAFDNDSVIGPAVTQVRVSTAAGQVTDRVAVTDAAQSLRVPAGPSPWLRITATGFVTWPDLSGGQVGIYDIAVPGVQAARTIVAPAVPGDPAAVVLTKTEPYPSGCMRTSLRWVCSPDLISPTQEQYGFDQTFNSAIPEQTVLRGSAILTSPSLVETYVRGKRHEPVVTASSAYTPDPQDQGLSAFDGNQATSWVASLGDAHPVLSIRWGYSRRISQVRIQRPPGARSGSLQVLINGSDGQLRGGYVGGSGVLRFAPMRTASLTFTFTTIQVPLQISEVRIPGVSPVRAPASGPVSLPCGKGPVLTVNGAAVLTRAAGSYADLLTGQPLEFTACGPVTVAVGANRVVEPASDAFSVQDVVFGAVPALPSGAPPSAGPAAAGIVRWTASARTLRVSAPVSSYLVINENYNTGWRAVIEGRQLRPVRLDGWKQAWLLPAGTSGLVHLTYGPEVLYRDVVLGGLVLIVLLALLALLAAWPGPRKPKGRGAAWTEEPRAKRVGDEGRRHLEAARRRAGAGTAVVLLVVVGLWLGGYPGAVLLPAVTLLFLVCASDGVPAAVGSVTAELNRAGALAVLLVVAAVCGAEGELLAQDGHTGLLVTALQNTFPQVICLAVIARLAAALILS